MHKYQGMKLIFVLVICGLVACRSSSNKRAINLDDLERVQAEDLQQMPAGPRRDALTAQEMLALAACKNLPCVQLFMKDLSADFLHAQKGEFVALHRSMIVDTSGNQILIPLSTLYVDVAPYASWRIAHTLHHIDIGNHLLSDFHQLGFALVDSGYYRGINRKQARFRSPQFPGTTLYVSSTYSPWYLKGLYMTVTWPCFVFEVYHDE